MNLHELFKQEGTNPTPSDLAYRTILKIDAIAVKSARQNKYLWGAISVLSLFFVFTASWETIGAVSASNFGTYFSLFFSDTGTAFSLWKEIGISLIDSLPILSIGILLASISVLGFGMKTFSKNNSRKLIISHAL
jgi:hypothetical protein